MTNKITRRATLSAGLAAGAASCTPAPKMTSHQSVSEGADGLFSHGVASGDPTHDGVVIWTRLFHEMLSSAPQSLTANWQISTQEDFSTIVREGAVTTNSARDWTVKALVDGLEPGTVYYYRFEMGGVVSQTGRTRTLPVGQVDNARFAVLSCSNYPFGYFNVYDLIARRDDLDAVIHLGDYFYEYGRDGYGGESGAALGREHIPAHEALTLGDYRTRHAQYKSDPASLAMHAAHAIIPIWDDHETANDSWKGGAENHDPATEGDWNDRKRAALQAYYEWMPVREPTATPAAFFRSYVYGDLLTLSAIETRLMARSEVFEYSTVIPTLKTEDDVEHFKKEILWDEKREMLGAQQLSYLKETLGASIEAGQPWRLIANQVVMAKVTAPDLTPHVTEEDIAELEQQWDQARAFVRSSTLGLPTNFDAWDGYPAARERFYDTVREVGQDGMIVVTGDTHTWWANDLVDKQDNHVGVELGTHSVTSPSPYRKSFLGGKGAEYALLTTQDNKDVRYLSGEDHGYIDLEVTHKKAKARFIAVDTVEKPEYNAFEKAAFTIKRSKGAAKFSGVNGLGLKERVLFR